MPVACPGSGKSYVAEEMVKAGIITPWAVVSSDYYREVVSDNRQDMAATPDAFDLCNTIIRARLKRGLDVYMDGTNLNKKFRDKDLEMCIRDRVENVGFNYLFKGEKGDQICLYSDGDQSLEETDAAGYTQQIYCEDKP